MDFSSFSQLLQDIILKNKSIIIPNVGCFVLEESNSEIQFAGKIISPPQTLLLFCTSEIENDGVLINELSLKHNVPLAQAEEMFNLLLEKMIIELDEVGEVVLERVGSIKKDAKGLLYFIPAPAEESFFVNFPLEPISVKPLDKNNNVEIELLIDDHNPIVEVPLVPISNAKESDSNTPHTDEEMVMDIIADTLPTIKKDEEPIGNNTEIENSKKESDSNKKMIYLTIILVSLILTALLIYIFREQLYILLENVLYSKEELEILRKAGKL